jgi:fatty acid desaturase
MKGHWFWDFAYLNSNYHLEHHYFPGVPFYRLPALQQALKPFYARKGMRWMTYGRLVYGWIVENRAPHTDWSLPSSATPGHAATPTTQPR